LRDVTAEHYAVQRDAAVAAVSLRLTRSAGLDEALQGVLAEIRRLWQADRVLAVVFDPDAEEPVVTAAPAGATRLDDRLRARLAALRDGPLLVAQEDGGGDGVAGGGFGVAGGLGGAGVANGGAAGGVGVCLEHPLGACVLWLDLDRRRPLTEQDRLLLSVLAVHLTRGLRRAHRIDQQRETALALQHAILGPSVPAGFAVRYEPAAQPLEVGGDWYDTVVLEDGRIGIVVGDCVGRGLEAATVMGQLRSACRALLLRDPRPDEVLVALDRFAVGIPGALCTTVFCGVLDPASGLLTYSSAGHPPGIITGPDGAIRLLDGAGSFPLAIRPGAPRPSATERVPARATLLLYTDGLIERRRIPLTEGIEAAGLALRDERDAGVEELVARVMARMAPAEGYEDDVAVLLYRHPGPFELVIPAAADRLAEARSGLREWLERCELPEPTAHKLLVAAGEACANSVEHAQHPGGEDGTVRIRAEAFAEHLTVTISDTGRWRERREPVPAHRGHGTDIMKAFTDDVVIDSGADGTVVTLQVRIPR
jgi:anti-sigma regulatory factor (Ser/Thr protein kinase)